MRRVSRSVERLADDLVVAEQVAHAPSILLSACCRAQTFA